MKTKGIIREWRPHPGPQTEAFRYYHVYEILYGGAKGGGKTDWLLFDFLDPDLIQNPNYRGIIFRRTFPRLREIIDRSLTWFKQIAHFNKQERSWTFSSGAKLFFAHCQHEESKYDYQGHEYQYMGFDQLEEFTESQYSFLKVQCRTSYPGIDVRIRSTGNPGNVGHVWVKRKFIDDKVPMQIYHDEFDLTSMFIPAKVYDNPSLVDNDPFYIKRLESLPEQERKALLEGDWNIFSGQFFREWTPKNHIIEPFYIPYSWKRFIAGDYGFRNPSSVGWYAMSPEGDLIRYKELYEENLHYETLAQKILDITADDKIEYCVFDPAIFGDKQHHKQAREGQSGAEMMQEIIGENFSILRGDNRRLIGWSNVREYLKIVDDECRFKVFNSCINFIKTFPANIHDTRRPEDLDTDGEDHTADEARYAIMSRPIKTDLTPEKVLNPNSAWGKIQIAKQNRNRGIYRAVR